MFLIKYCDSYFLTNLIVFVEKKFYNYYFAEKFYYYIFRIVNGLSGQDQAHAQTVAVRMGNKADKGDVYFETVILLAALVLGVLTILSVVHEEIVLLGHNGRNSDLAAHHADNEANGPAQEDALSRVKERKLDE